LYEYHFFSEVFSCFELMIFEGNIEMLKAERAFFQWQPVFMSYQHFWGNQLQD